MLDTTSQTDDTTSSATKTAASPANKGTPMDPNGSTGVKDDPNGATSKTIVEVKTHEQMEEEQAEKDAATLQEDRKTALDKLRAKKAGKDAGKAGDKPVDTTKQPDKKADAEKGDTPAPASWKKDISEKHWKNLDPEVRAYILETDRNVAREFSKRGENDKQVNQKLTQYAQQLESVTPLMKTLGKDYDWLRSQGIPAHEVVGGLIDTAKRLNQSPKTVIAELAKAYKVDLVSFAYEGLDHSQLPPDPRISDYETQLEALARENAQLKKLREVEQADQDQYLKQQEKAQHDSTVTQLQGWLDNYAQTKPHFEVLEGAMMSFLPGMISQYGRTEEAVNRAYRAAALSNPAVQDAIVESRIRDVETKRNEEAKRQADAAQRAGRLNAPGNAAPTGGDNLHTARMAALQRARAKAGQSRTF